jgi:redox-sensitive bicupin YhaK (pirin superfamily)
MIHERLFDHVFDLQPFAHGAEFHGYGLRDPALHPALDPFLSVDHFRMSASTFAPHPHAGFSAVTYLFADSETGFTNRDSLGNHIEIAPGALHWTQAARGMMHEEIPQQTGKVAHGLQIFVNLPAHQKHRPPAIFHSERRDMPEFVLDGCAVRVVFGRYAGHDAGLQPAESATLVEIAIPTGSRIRAPVPAGLNAFVLVVEGKLHALHAGESTLLGPSKGGSLAAVESDGLLTLAAPHEHTRIALFLGSPLRESVVFGGPFVMNTQEQIMQARRDFAAGHMGHLGESD